MWDSIKIEMTVALESWELGVYMSKRNTADIHN